MLDLEAFFLNLFSHNGPKHHLCQIWSKAHTHKLRFIHTYIQIDRLINKLSNYKND